MNEAELRRIAGSHRVPVGMVEKDYVLSVMSILLANDKARKNIVFKGGTAIKKIYYPEARFSEDLDFNYLDLSISDVKDMVLRCIGTCPLESVEFTVIKDEYETEDGFNCRVGFRGPLNHDNSIKLDFSGKERPLTRTLFKPIIEEYRSQEELGILASMQVLSLEEILSEKCRALMMRPAPRDLYDIWFLLSKGVKLDELLVRKKLKPYREDWNEEAFEDRIEDLDATWQRDLTGLLPEVPDFNNVVKSVRSQLKFF